MIVAIDGPAGAGKGTLAKSLAAHLGYPHLDTGALYRATALAVLRAGGDPDDPAAAERAARSLDTAILDSPDLRSAEVGAASSKVAAIPAVRAALLDFQRNFAHRPPGAVLDGRDVGTVVVPEAEAKLFVTASAAVRAQRRHQELQERGEASIYARVLADIEARDARDAGRADAPMRKADDAVEIDTSDLSPSDVFKRALAVIEAAGTS
ncbi:(d)CMP kinase [Thalassobaculum litoreum]|uniref:Cytidylate kinase n=1 Tax=Thalassobaculum litoreum DSM 18839 TaxID=1123362 RepID=A0A8G2BF31_9PROT|nr:(d)CMP kinase [Thalassobaculum litoreum]SDF28208.1 cytidylate kinase [Thalassobaculum litoreum DSM 18839]